jgi:hypothetical protein
VKNDIAVGRNFSLDSGFMATNSEPLNFGKCLDEQVYEYYLFNIYIASSVLASQCTHLTNQGMAIMGVALCDANSRLNE